MRRSSPSIALLAVALCVGLAGCNEDERLAEMARQTAEASRQLVEADAKARQELAALQHDLQAEQARVGQQRDALESERRSIVSQRYWEPIIAAVLADVGLVLACLIPLLVCIYLLRAVSTRADDDQELVQLLTQELVAEQPVLLPSPRDARRIGHGGTESPADRREQDSAQGRLRE